MPAKREPKTIERFIRESTQTHGDKYDYLNSKYNKKTKQVNITCRIHGEFLQSFYVHIAGHGCMKCIEDKNRLRATPIDKIIEKARAVHGNRYDYSMVDTPGIKFPMKIICKDHGLFIQSGEAHIHAQQNCPQCADTRLTTEIFIERSIKKHGNKFDYSQVNYINHTTKVIIFCPKHGKSLQYPLHHIKTTHGCNKCGKNVSNGETKWLDTFNIPLENRSKRIDIESKHFKVDAYDPVTNTIYEFNGDFWHGNPDLFNLNDINNATKSTFRHLYNKTMAKAAALQAAGYNLISIWENDWNKQQNNK